MSAGIVRVEQSIAVESIVGVPGNCLQAAVVSLLGLPLEAVPHFVLFDRWFEALVMWASGKDLIVVKRYDDDVPVLAFGKSPRGVFSHAVVIHNGVVLADPHPDQSGLDGEPYERWTFVALTPTAGGSQ